MKYQKRTVQVVALVGITVVVFTWPVLAQDCPEFVGSHGTGEEAAGVAVSGDYAYVADYTDVLWVINVSDPAYPVTSGWVDIQMEPSDVAVSRAYAYVVGHRYPFLGLRVIDVSDPSLPFLVGYFDDGLGIPSAVAVSGHYVFVTGSYVGLSVIDVSNPTAPTKVGHCNPWESGHRIELSGRYAYEETVPGTHL